VSDTQTLGHHVFRRNVHRFVIPVIWGVPIFIFALFAVTATPFLWIGVVPCLWLAYRTARIGVFTSPQGVRIRNIMASRRLDWADIERFDWGDSHGFPIGGAVLRDKSFVRATALNPPLEIERGQNSAVPNALAGLNRELERARAAAGPSAGSHVVRSTEPVEADQPNPDQLSLE
jgi:hypothetical protein